MSNFGKPYVREVPGPRPTYKAVPGLSRYQQIVFQDPDGVTLEDGPHAPKDVFPQIDPQGYQNKEVLSTVVNNMLIGKLNAVNQKALALADIPPGTTHMTVFDIRVSPFSMVFIQPESSSAAFLTLIELGKGYFNLGFSEFLLGQIAARGSMLYSSPVPDADLVIPQDPATVVVPFSAAGTPAAELFTLSFPTMTTQMAGYYELSIRIDMTMTQNETYHFIFTAGGVEFGRLEYTLAGTSVEIHDTLSFYADVDENVVLGLEVSQNGGGTGTGSGTIEYRAVRVGNSPTHADNLPAGTLDDILFKYAVIG